MAVDSKIRVITLVPFLDIAEDTMRSVGDQFDVTAARMAEINSAGQQQVGQDLVEMCAPKKRGRKAAAAEEDGD